MPGYAQPKFPKFVTFCYELVSRTVPAGEALGLPPPSLHWKHEGPRQCAAAALSPAARLPDNRPNLNPPDKEES